MGASRHAALVDADSRPVTEVAGTPCKIGTAARAVGLSEHRVREYERAGLIRPAREARTNDRLFGAAEIRQLRLLKQLVHEQGFTLAMLQDLIRRAPCWRLVACTKMHLCPVPRDPFTPCFTQRARGVPVACDTECARCAIYCTGGGTPAADCRAATPAASAGKRPVTTDDAPRVEGSRDERLLPVRVLSRRCAPFPP